MPIRWRCRNCRRNHARKLHENDWAFIQETINGIFHRESLHTQSPKEAQRRYREKLKEYQTAAPDPSKGARKLKKLTIAEVIELYIEDRKADVSKGQVKAWRVNARALSGYFGNLRLEQINNAHISEYKNQRLEKDGIKPKSLNNELATLRLLLKHADQWFRVCAKFRMAKITREREGRALDQDEQIRLFMVAQSKPKYRWTCVLLVLCHYCGMRPCESFGLRWRDINWQKRFLTIMRSKTQAGWRYPSLNETCLAALRMLRDQAVSLGIAEPDHYIFPYHPRGRFRKNEPPLDPTRPMTKYARQWNEIRKEAGLEGFWFYDGRHTAFTQMQEAGLPDATIRAQVGHISAQVAKRYSHIRRQELNRAAEALEPSFLKNVLLISSETDQGATVQ